MASFSDSLTSLLQLFVQQLDSLYDGEQRIAYALPRLTAKAASSQLKSALQNDSILARQQIGRLNRIFGDLGHQPGAESDGGMEALLAEGDKLLARCRTEALADACIILTAQRLHHYKVAGYGTLKSFAHQLGWGNLGQILDHCLHEERDADGKLTEISEALNRKARTAA
jgi:ferritin-like metal-binding protein YciE